MADLLYIDRIPAQERRDFAIKLFAVCKLLGIANANWLMMVFKKESGVNPAAQNTAYPFYKNGVLDGYATGLIQFIPSTARGLGTTTTALRQMSATKQLDYVYLYLEKYKGRLNSYFDVYLVVFFPAAIGHTNDDNWVFETKNVSRSSVARNNPTTDLNKDGIVTMREFKGYVINGVPAQYRPLVFGNSVPNYIPGAVAASSEGLLWGALLVGVLLANK